MATSACFLRTFLSCTMFLMGASVPTTTTIPEIDILQSAVFSCDKNNVLSSIFPPSDRSLGLIDNVTEAAALQKNSMDTFCADRQKYVKCVQRKLTNPKLPIDRHMSVYIDVESFGTAFDMYCDSAVHIQRQFECTLNATATFPCHIGGVSGMVDQIYAAIVASLSQQQFCATMEASIQCRVRCQLQMCDGAYSSVMQDFYYFFTGKYCPRQSDNFIDISTMVCPNATVA